MRFAYVIFLLSTLSLITACSSDSSDSDDSDETTNQNGDSDDDDNAVSNPIVGDWEIVEAEGTAASMNIGTPYYFGNDGQFAIGEGILVSEGEWSERADTLVLDFESMDMDFLYLYEFQGEQLVLDMVFGDQVFYLEKD